MDGFFNYNEILYMSYNESHNGKYRVYHKLGSGCVSGSFVLLFKNKVLFNCDIEKLSSVKVANNGLVFVHDDVDKMETNGKMLLYDKDGNMLLEIEVTANIINTAISANGLYAYFETVNSDTDDANKFFIVNTKELHVESKFDSPFCAIGVTVDFDTAKKQLKFNLPEGEKVINFNGDLII